MSDINKVLSCLSGVRQRGQDKWIACCPSHADSNPSLSIALKDDRVLFKCWSGCGGVQIMNDIGLPMSCFAPQGVLDNKDTRLESVFGPRPKRTASEDDYLIAIAKAKRDRGERLTSDEKRLEFEAWRRSRKQL